MGQWWIFLIMLLDLSQKGFLFNICTFVSVQTDIWAFKMKSAYLKKTITHTSICVCIVYVTEKKRVECSEYSGDNEVAFDIPGEAQSLVVENSVAYYATIKPTK